MPVAVSFPTRIRVDSAALETRRDWIEDALSAALGRALDNSVKTVLEPRGGYVDVVAEAPSFLWRGVPIDERRRGEIELQIASRIAALLRERDIGVRPRAPEVIPASPSELFDPSRGFAAAGVYVVDSYGGGSVPMNLDGKVTAPQSPEISIVRSVGRIDDPLLLSEMRRLAQRASPDAPLGLIFRLTGGLGKGWQVLVTDGTLPPVGAFAFDRFTYWAVAGPRDDQPYRQRPYIPSPARGRAEIVDVATSGGVAAVVRTHMLPKFIDGLRRNWPQPVDLTIAKYKKALDMAGERFVAVHADHIAEKRPAKAIIVRMGGAHMVLWMMSGDEPFLRWKGTAELRPLVQRVPRPEKKKGGGGESEKEARRAPAQPGGSGHGLCPPDGRPPGHPPDDIEESQEDVPFLGEPSLEEIGDAGETLAAKIAPLATALQIPAGHFAGRFCYRAASMLLAEALATQLMAETATGHNRASVNGNLGAVQFTPDASPVIVRIRELASIVSKLGNLIGHVESLYMSQSYQCSIHGLWRGQGAAWALRLGRAVAPIVEEAVGEMFIGACRSSLLQLLAASRWEIQKRQRAIDRYAPLFESWIVPMIADLGELETMRRKLRDHAIEKNLQVALTAEMAAGEAWLAASAQLVQTLSKRVSHSVGEVHGIVEEAGEARIRDGKGRLWSKSDLESALRQKGQLAEGADPLVKQLADAPEAMEKLKDSDSIERTLKDLLAEMVGHNIDVTDEATHDPSYAFKSGKFQESRMAPTVRCSKYALQGLHRIAHEQIGDAFAGSAFYGEGIDRLFDTELGKEALLDAGAFIGMVAISVLVPASAALIITTVGGGALAAHELAKASDKERLYKSLINPDLVIHHAEVETAKFLAWFGVVMAALPAGGAAAKGLVGGGKAILAGEGRALGKIAGRAVARQVSRDMAEYAAKDLLAAFVQEAVIAVAIDRVIQQAMAPMIDALEAEAQLTVGNVDWDRMTEGAPPDDGMRAFIDMILADETEGAGP